MWKSKWVGRTLTVVCLLWAGVVNAESEPGRTDGAEGSEYGRGGYARYGTGGKYYLEGYLGSAQVDFEVEGADSLRTDLMGGLNAGYQIEDWLSFQVGYGYISDQKISLFGAGMRITYDVQQFAYFLSLDAELFVPDQGDSKFGIAPGAGAELQLSDRLRVGLAYQHDFIMSDDNLDIDRYTARIQFGF